MSIILQKRRMIYPISNTMHSTLCQNRLNALRMSIGAQIIEVKMSIGTQIIEVLQQTCGNMDIEDAH